MTNKKSNKSFFLFLIPISATLLLLFIGLWRLNWSMPPISGLESTLNDQAGYISGARYLIDRGEIDNCIIYPSILLQKYSQKVFYGPGYYYAMSIPILIFGSNEISFMLINIICLFLCVYIIFLCSKKLFSISSALISSLLFLSFPFVLLYGISSMAEITIVFFTFLSFWFAIYFKDTHFRFLSLIFVLVSVFFRETSIVSIFPIAGILFNEQIKKKKYKEVLIFILIALLCWIFIMLFPLGNRPSLFKANIFCKNTDKYTDAYAYHSFFPTIDIWMNAIFDKLIFNINYIFFDTTISIENFVLKILILLTISISLSGYLRKDYLDIGISIMSIGIFLFICTLYTPVSMRGIRMCLILVPFFCVSFSRLFINLRFNKILILYLILIPFGLSIFIINSRDFYKDKMLDNKKAELLSSLSFESNEVLVSSFRIGIPWVFRNYPLKWSFLPANIETMKLLNKKYLIRTIVLSENEINENTSRMIEYFDFVLVNSLESDGNKLFVFRRRKDI